MLSARTLLTAGGVVVCAGIAAALYTWVPVDLPPAVIETESSANGDTAGPPARFDVETADPPAGTVQGNNEQLHETQLLREEITSLRSDLETLKSQLASVAATVTTLSRRADTTAAAEERLMEDASYMEAHLAQQDEQNDQYMADIETSLLNEQTDPQWSSRASSSIEQALLSEHLTDTALVAVDCRFTLCRVEVEHDSPQALAQFQTAFSQLIEGAELQPAIVDTESAEDWSTTVVYLIRDGYSLPNPQP